MVRRDGTETGLCLPDAKRERELRGARPDLFEPVRFRNIKPAEMLTKW